MTEIIYLEDYRKNPSDIAQLKAQTWPLNRVKGDFRKERREAAELELRTVICGFCGKRSRKLDGPTGRAWFAAHECRVSA